MKLIDATCCLWQNSTRTRGGSNCFLAQPGFVGPEGFPHPNTSILDTLSENPNFSFENFNFNDPLPRSATGRAQELDLGFPQGFPLHLVDESTHHNLSNLSFMPFPRQPPISIHSSTLRAPYPVHLQQHHPPYSALPHEVQQPLPDYNPNLTFPFLDHETLRLDASHDNRYVVAPVQTQSALHYQGQQQPPMEQNFNLNRQYSLGRCNRSLTQRQALRYGHLFT